MIKATNMYSLSGKTHFTNIEIDAMDVEFYLDCGAAVNSMPREFAQNWPQNQQKFV